MPTAINPQTGEILTLGADGAWAPAPRAKNPETGQEIFQDGNEWKPVPYRARMPADLRGKAEVYDGLARSRDQGFSLGFADEATSAVSATLGKIADVFKPGDGKSWSDRYKERLEFEREMLKEYQKQSPIKAMGAEIIGGLALAPMAGTSVKGAQTLAQTAKDSAKMGGLLGGVTGFGTGEGGFEERAKNAAMAGTIGAAAGGVTPYLIAGGQKAADVTRNFFGQGDQTARSERLLARALQQDNMTPDMLPTRAAEMEARGIQGATVADLGGENTRRLARAAATVPGEGTAKVQAAVEARNAGQASALLDDVKTYISPIDDFHGLMDSVGKAQAKAATPLYEEAFATHKFVSNPRIDNFLGDPVMKQGINKGLEIQRLEALAEGRKMTPLDYGAVDFDQAGNYVTGGRPNLRLLDAAKRGLDEILNEARDGTTGKIVWTERLKKIDDVRRAFVDELDKVTAAQNGGRSVYAEARQAWAGPAAAKDALAFGRRDVFRADPEVIARRMASMTDGEREFVKAGVARGLADIINGKADDLDITKGLLRNPEMRKRLRAVFGEDVNLDRFIANIETRREMMKTDQFISPRTGSQTTMRAADAAQLLQDPTPIPMEAAGQALRGNLVGAALTAAQGQVPRLTQGITARTGSSLADLLLQPGAAGSTDVLKRLQQRALADALRRGNVSRGVAGLLAPAEGAAIGLQTN